MNDKKEIYGKVARILSSRELVLNVGQEDGVEVGMFFDILSPEGDEIRDPDSGEVLGSIRKPKVRVKISSVQERLSVAATFRKKIVNEGGTATFAGFGEVARAFIPPKMVERYETFKSDEAAWEQLDESESFVKIGDPAVCVLIDMDE